MKILNQNNVLNVKDMKIRVLSVFSLAVSVLLSGSCVMDKLHVAENTIHAEMENDQTRTSVTDEGSFTWSSGDQVWLHTTSGNVAGTLSSGAGTSSADFSYGAFFGEMTGKAVYPYNSGHAVTGDELSVVLPASYDLGSNLSNTNAAMYGVNVDGTIRFNHLAGVMRFVFKNVPAGTDRFQITLDKKINGTFTADLAQDYPVIEAAATSTASEKTVTLNFDALTKISDISLYVPLPTGTYTTLGLDLWAGSQSVWTYSNTVTNTISRKTLKLMPSVSMGGSIGGEIEGGGSDDPVEEPKEQLEFNENHCIYYRANKTGGWDSGMNNYHLKKSHISCSAGGQIMEMKFKMMEIPKYDEAYLASNSNQAKDLSDEFVMTNSGLALDVNISDDEWYTYNWTWEETGVSPTDLITLRFSGADETVTINGKVLECAGLKSVGWSYMFSGYFRENDEGVWESHYGVPEGSHLYYVKMYGSDGSLTYHGYAAKAVNPATSELEYCWCSVTNGTTSCQFANDAKNQGGYTGNF